MQITTRIAGLLLVGTAALAAPVKAQTLRDALPADTVLYLSAPDIETSLAELNNMPLMRMWREEEVQDFFADAMKMLEAKIEEGLDEARAAHDNGMIPFDPDKLMKLRVKGAGLAVTSLDLTPGDFEPQPKFGVIAHLDFGDTAGQWRKVISWGLKMVEAQAGGMLTPKTSKVGDIELLTWVPPETEMSLNVAFVGTGVVIGTIESEVKGVLEAMSSGTARLSQSNNFKSTFKKLDLQGAELEMYFQLTPILDFGMRVLKMAKEQMPGFPEQIEVDGIDRAITALGLRSLKGVGATCIYEGNKCISKGYTYAPAPERKGLFAGAHKNISLDFLKWVPKDAASFSAMTFDLSSVWDALVGALKAYDADTADMALGMLAQYEQQLGVSIKEDLLGSLGDEFISWSMPLAAFGTTPEMAILMKVRDQGKFLKTLQTLTKLSEGMVEIEENERRGITVYQVNINFDPSGGMGINPLDMFSPTFAFKNGYMVAGFSPGDVKRVFKRMDREDDPKGDIRGNPEFAPYLEKMPNGGITSISFTDWKASFEGLYQIVASVAAFVPVSDDVPIDLSLLPDVQTLTQHLFGAVSWSTGDGEGSHHVSVGPWGPETVALLAGAVGVGVGVAVTMTRGF